MPQSQYYISNKISDGPECVRQCRVCGEVRPIELFPRTRHWRMRTCRRCKQRRYEAGAVALDFAKARIAIRERVLEEDRGHSSECWIWQSRTEEKGYARTPVAGYSRRAVHVHRAAYELFVGPIPDGLTIDHLCCVTSCVNPAHLEPVSSQENRRRQTIAARERKALAELSGGTGKSSNEGLDTHNSGTLSSTFPLDGGL